MNKIWVGSDPSHHAFIRMVCAADKRGKVMVEGIGFNPVEITIHDIEHLKKTWDLSELAEQLKREDRGEN